MNRLAAAISFAALLPLAGCATPYGYSKGAWAYYDRDFDFGQEGYQRPVTYYGEAVYGRPYGNDSTLSEPQYSEWSYECPPMRDSLTVRHGQSIAAIASNLITRRGAALPGRTPTIRPGIRPITASGPSQSAGG